MKYEALNQTRWNNIKEIDSKVQPKIVITNESHKKDSIWKLTLRLQTFASSLKYRLALLVNRLTCTFMNFLTYLESAAVRIDMFLTLSQVLLEAKFGKLIICRRKHRHIWYLSQNCVVSRNYSWFLSIIPIIIFIVYVLLFDDRRSNDAWHLLLQQALINCRARGSRQWCSSWQLYLSSVWYFLDLRCFMILRTFILVMHE